MCSKLINKPILICRWIFQTFLTVSTDINDADTLDTKLFAIAVVSSALFLLFFHPSKCDRYPQKLALAVHWKKRNKKREYEKVFECQETKLAYPAGEEASYDRETRNNGK